MIINKLILHNFLVHLDREFVFDKPVMSICGNNGAGKSSIMQAITTALFKSQERGNLDDLITYGKDECQIELEFTVDSNYRIVYTKKRGQTPVHLLFKDNTIVAETTTATTTFVKDLLNIDYDGFIGSVFCPQDKLNFITGLKPDARKEVISSFLGISGLLKIGTKAQDIRREISLRKERVRGMFDITQAQLDNVRKQLEIPIDADQVNEQQLINAINNIIEEIEQYKSTVNIAKQLQNLESIIENNQSSIDSLLVELSDVENFDVKEAEDIQSQLDIEKNKLIELKQLKVDEQRKIYSDIATTKSRLEIIENSIKTITQLDKCPTCMRVVTELDKQAIIINNEPISSTLKSGLDKLECEFNKIQELLLSIDKHINENAVKIQGLNALLSKHQVKSKYTDMLQKLYTQQAQYREQFESLQNQIKDFDINKYNGLIQEKEQLQHILDLTKSKITTWNINKSTEEKLRKDLDIHYNQLKLLSSEVDDYKLIENIYNEQGIITYAIGKFIGEIEGLTNQILNLLSPKLSILFKIDTKKLDVIVKTPESILPYELRSGGEKAKVDLSLRLALAILIQNTKGRKLQTLFLDEALAAIDVEGRQNFMKVLEFLRPYFSRILSISHLNDVNDNFYEKIEL